MTPAAADAKDAPQLEDDALRQAMLSVYFRSLGSELETTGAPAIAVPPYVEPQPLDEALAILETREDLLWDAYWRIVRSVPVGGRYPAALVRRLGRDKINEIDTARRQARADAQLVGDVLVAIADERWSVARALAPLLLQQRADADPTKADLLETLTRATLDVSVEGLHDRAMGEDEGAAEELHTLQNDVGIDLEDFVADFADTVAFDGFRPADARQDGMSVMTSSCVVRQNTETLTTTATVTALADAEDFKVLARAIDPLGWPKRSNVIVRTAYMDDPFRLDSLWTTELGQSFTDPRLLFEEVDVRWGADDTQTGRFRNVLVIPHFEVDEGEESIDLEFALYRSIDSRLLWDSRAGGIRVDDGYIQVRKVREGRWSVTSRKVLMFSDRTPYSNLPGWLDFGQLLNYLAPASVTWWLETEIYTARHPAYQSGEPPAAGPIKRSAYA
jgi:hypothetical protein